MSLSIIFQTYRLIDQSVLLIEKPGHNIQLVEGYQYLVEFLIESIIFFKSKNTKGPNQSSQNQLRLPIHERDEP
jgi:hypothetical protein